MKTLLKPFKRAPKTPAEPEIESKLQPDGAAAPSVPIEETDCLVKVRIEPNSEETKSQSLLGPRDVMTPTFSIGRRPGFVGRYEGCADFSIREMEPYTVSREHCVLELGSDHLIVRDLSSRYGTIVNGVRLGGPRKKSSEIKLGAGLHKLVLGPRDSTMCFKLIVG